MGTAGQGLYSDPWLASQATQVPSSLLPGAQQPQGFRAPTAESMGMSEDEFKKYITVNKDGTWSYGVTPGGHLRAKGFMGLVAATMEGIGQQIGAVDKAVSKVPVLGQVYEANKWVAKNLVMQPLDKLGQGAYWLYGETVSQPLTTTILQMGKASQGQGGAVFSGKEWAESYAKAEHISPGQAAENMAGVHGVSPLELAARVAVAPATFGISLMPTDFGGPKDKFRNESYLYDTDYWRKQNGWKYDVGTGLMDAQASVFLDPTTFVGKGVKAVRGAQRAVQVAEGVTKGPKILGGGRTAESLVGGKKFEAFANWGIGKSPEEIRLALERGRGSRYSSFTNRDMAAQLADVLSKADNVDDWRLATRFAMGDAAAFTEMSQRSQAFALAYGKALDHRIDITNADKLYTKSYNALVENGFQAKGIKPKVGLVSPSTGPATYVDAAGKKQTLPKVPGKYEVTPSGGRSPADRIAVDEQGALIPKQPYLAPGVEESDDLAKPFEQLKFEGKEFNFQVKPLEPGSIPTNYFEGLKIPGMLEWRTGVQSALEAQKVQLAALAAKDPWLSRALTDTETAAANPLFGSMKEARFAGVGRDVTKQAERRAVQYLGVRADDGFQSRLLQNGIYGATVRFVGKMGDRLPTGVINHNEGDASSKLAEYLKASPIDNQTAADIVKDYSRISDKVNSTKYIEDLVEPMLLESFGKKYNLDKEVTQELYNQYRRVSAQEMDKARHPKQIYSATTEDGTRIDKLVDGETVAASPQLSTQLQYASVLPNLKSMDKFFAKNAPGISRARLAGMGAADALSNVIDGYNSLFKLSALLRVAYPIRNVTEETLARTAKFGAMAILADTAHGGLALLRNAPLFGAVLDASGRTVRKVEVNRSLAPVQSMLESLTQHETTLKSMATFSADPTEASRLKDRLATTQAAIAEFQSYERELLNHASRGVARSGEGTFHYRGQAHPEAFNTEYAGAIPRDQITSSESWKTVFSRVETFMKEDMMRSGNYVSMSPTEPGHLNAWERAVNLQLLQDPVALSLVRDGTGDSALRFLRSPEGAIYRKNLGEAGRRDPAEHIRLIKAMVDQYIPESMREQAARNGKVAAADFKAVALEERPLVHGEELKAATKGNDGAFAFYDKLNEKWFQGLPRMASDRLSWQPVYVRAHRMHYQELVDLHYATEAKLGREATHISTDLQNKFMQQADKAARATMREVLYQPSKTNFAHAVRHISPFFSAYADSMSRWGGMVMESPDLIGKMAKIYNAPVAANLVTDRAGDKVGTDGSNSRGEFVGMNDRVLNFQINPLTKNLPAGIKDMRINIGSMNVVTPGEPWWNPGFGPLVSIPADTVMRNFPETSSFLNWINPYGTQAESFLGEVGRSITPNWIEGFAFDMDKDSQRYQDALMASYRTQMVDYHKGERTKAPDWKEAEKDASLLLFLNVVADGVLPGKTRQMDKYQFYIDALQNLRKEDPANANDLFMARYGQDFKEYADAQMFLAAGTKSGTGVPSTINGVVQDEKFGDLIKAHPELGGFIVGDVARTDEFNQWALLNQKASGDRTTVTAEDRIKQTSVNSGWNAFVKISQAIEADMVDRGLYSLNQKGGEDLAALKQRAVLAIANKYPEWAADYTTTDRDAIPKRIAALTEIVTDPRLAKDPTRTADIGLMRNYLAKRQEFMKILAAREKAGGSSAINTKNNQDVAQAWDTYRSALSEKNLKFGEILNRYLSQDNLQSSIIGG